MGALQAAGGGPPEPLAPAGRLLEEPYAVEVSASFPAALLHWLDSLTETTPPFGTAGKTTPAHRLAYQRVAGRLTDDDVRLLLQYREIRVGYGSGLTVAFFEAATLDRALEAAAPLLDRPAAGDLRAVIERFAPSYRKIWNDGEVPRGFLERAAAEGLRNRLAKFLAGAADFFGVTPAPPTLPRILLAPVDPGSGTHAQAIGRYLLVEVRADETLADEIGPIVHENVHFLFNGMARERLAELEDAALAVGPWGARAWDLLREALPTAIAQGVATHQLARRRFAMEDPWYHLGEVDRYAKRLFPLVRRALAARGSFDEAFVAEAVAAFTHQ